MISPEEFKTWRLRPNLSNEARALINQVRTSEPVRAARCGGNNVIGLYPSRKMGRTYAGHQHGLQQWGISGLSRNLDDKEWILG
jgi:putative transposase